MFEELAVLLAAAFSLGWIAVHLKRRQIIRRLARLDNVQPDIAVSDTTVSVILPVRNEARNIERFLSSVRSQRGLSVEVIVVDDGSTDGTYEALLKHAWDGLVVVKSSHPPEGWMGKSWACHLGYTRSKGEWLLFTDADAVFSPETIVKAVTLAKQTSADVLTLVPRFRMPSILHKITMPLLLTGLYLLARLDKIAEGKSAFVFGTFILIRRESYEKIGGHKSVRSAILEDRALAYLAHSKGLKAEIALALNHLTASWNEDSRSFWNGMQRLFVPLFLNSENRKAAFYISLGMISTIAYLVVTIFGNTALALTCYVLPSIVLGIEAKRHRSSFLYGMFWPIALVVLLTALYSSLIRAKWRPAITWRGRRYLLRRGESYEIAVLICSEK
jgi:glycosyltransferase involved in cell wall biosynthesis